MPVRVYNMVLQHYPTIGHVQGVAFGRIYTYILLQDSCSTMDLVTNAIYYFCLAVHPKKQMDALIGVGHSLAIYSYCASILGSTKHPALTPSFRQISWLLQRSPLVNVLGPLKYEVKLPKQQPKLHPKFGSKRSL